MPDNPKLKKLDSKRISIQKHELNYIVKKAEELIELCYQDQNHTKEFNKNHNTNIKSTAGFWSNNFSTVTIIRICKGLIKLSAKHKK